MERGWYERSFVEGRGGKTVTARFIAEQYAEKLAKEGINAVIKGDEEKGVFVHVPNPGNLLHADAWEKLGPKVAAAHRLIMSEFFDAFVGMNVIGRRLAFQAFNNKKKEDGEVSSFGYGFKIAPLSRKDADLRLESLKKSDI